MHKLIFTTLAIPGKPELDTLLLIESIRTFGGNLAQNPIWVLIPEALGSLSPDTQERLAQQEVSTMTFKVDPETLKFPFAAKVEAAAFAEQQAQGQSERLVFMDRDTLVLQEPAELLIPTGKALGYRPVHHKLIGPAWDQPLDAFWSLIYDSCGVHQENLFPMMTHTGEQIQPYFNSGIFVLRPERGLLIRWKNEFLKWYRRPQFQAFYKKDQLYSIFIHQAIFTGVLLAALNPKEMQLLSPKINYPLHLHQDIPAEQRPTTIDELVTVRYESIFDEPGWQQLPITEPLKSWLESQPRVQPPLKGQR